MDTPKVFSLTKDEISKLIEDGTLLSSLKKHGVSDDALAEVAKNVKLRHTVKSDEYTGLTFQFDPSKKGFYVKATVRF